MTKEEIFSNCASAVICGSYNKIVSTLQTLAYLLELAVIKAFLIALRKKQAITMLLRACFWEPG